MPISVEDLDPKTDEQKFSAEIVCAVQNTLIPFIKQKQELHGWSTEKILTGVGRALLTNTLLFLARSLRLSPERMEEFCERVEKIVKEECFKEIQKKENRNDRT